MGKNQQVLAVAMRRAVAKTKKIKTLGITPTMTDEEVSAMIETLSAAKAETVGGLPEQYVDGQEWYVNDLKEFSALDGQGRLDKEYDDAMIDSGEETDKAAYLEALM